MTTRTLGLGMLIALGCAPDPTLFGATAEGTAGGSGGSEGGGATGGATTSEETTGPAGCLDDCAGEVLWTRELDEFPYDMAVEADGAPALVLGKLGEANRIVRYGEDGIPFAEILLEEAGRMQAIAAGGPTVVAVDLPGSVTELRRVDAQGLGAVWARSAEHEGQSSTPNDPVRSAPDGWTHLVGTERPTGAEVHRAWVDGFAPDGSLAWTWTWDFDAGSSEGSARLVASREGGAFDVTVESLDGPVTLIRATAEGTPRASLQLDPSTRRVVPSGTGFTVLGSPAGGISLVELTAELEFAGPIAIDPLAGDEWPIDAVAIPDGTLVATMRLGPPVSLELRRYDGTGALVGITAVAPASPTSSPAWAQLAARADAVYMLGEDSVGDATLGWLRRIAL